jgi:pilus assembly protein CpaF
MSTVHANSPSDALLRLEMLAGLANFQGSEDTLRKMIAAAIELVVQIGRLPNGQRKILSITEITGVRDNQIITNELYAYDEASNSFTASNSNPYNHKLRNFAGAMSW